MCTFLKNFSKNVAFNFWLLYNEVIEGESQMKKKKLKIGRLILVNILILSIFVFILLTIPDIPEFNLTVAFMYVIIATLFNIFITEK